MSVEEIRHPETGEILRRDVRPFKMSYGGLSVMVDHPGWWGESGAAVFSQQDEGATEPAFLKLKARADKLRSERIRKARKLLKLSQAEASRILGGGPKAFQKYESGEVPPPRRLEAFLSVLIRHREEVERLKNEDDPLAVVDIAA